MDSPAPNLENEPVSESAPRLNLSAVGILAIAVAFGVLAYLAPLPASRSAPDVIMINAAPNEIIARYYVPIRGEQDTGDPATWRDLMVAFDLGPSSLGEQMAAYDRRRQATTQTQPEDPLPEGETIEIPLQ